MSINVVTGALVIAKKEDGSDLYLYQGAVLPDSISSDEVKRLTALGLVGKPDDPKSVAKPSAESN